LIASGGVKNRRHRDELEKIGCAGVIVGKAIYEGKIKLKFKKSKIGILEKTRAFSIFVKVF
jgi:phosphoribosylformimino-5-aminoimidazole carboxamide ribonucleotide (ProFAR) isomerase